MFKRIKNYIEYRRNLRKFKRELVKTAASALAFFNKTVSAASKTVEKFRKNSGEIAELMDYIAKMEPEELHKLFERAGADTLKNNDE